MRYLRTLARPGAPQAFATQPKNTRITAGLRNTTGKLSHQSSPSQHDLQKERKKSRIMSHAFGRVVAVANDPTGSTGFSGNKCYRLVVVAIPRSTPGHSCSTGTQSHSHSRSRNNHCCMIHSPRSGQAPALLPRARQERVLFFCFEWPKRPNVRSSVT